MALEIYWGSGSGPSWRVLLALAIKNVPYESKLLSFSNREHKSPDMLAKNPRGKLPVLVDGDFVLYESLAILVYLERKHPSPPLFGDNAEDAGRIMRVVMEHESYGLAAISAFCRPLLFDRLDVQRDQVLLARSTARAPSSRVSKPSSPIARTSRRDRSPPPTCSCIRRSRRSSAPSESRGPRRSSTASARSRRCSLASRSGVRGSRRSTGTRPPIRPTGEPDAAARPPSIWSRERSASLTRYGLARGDPRRRAELSPRTPVGDLLARSVQTRSAFQSEG